jgi:hypothetical protein
MAAVKHRWRQCEGQPHGAGDQSPVAAVLCRKRPKTFWPQTGKVGFESGTAVQNGWGTGKARERLDSAKTALGLIHFLLSLVLSWHCLGPGQAMAWQTTGRRSDVRNRAGHALTGQYLGASLDFAVSSALPNLRIFGKGSNWRLVRLGNGSHRQPTPPSWATRSTGLPHFTSSKPTNPCNPFSSCNLCNSFSPFNSSNATPPPSRRRGRAPLVAHLSPAAPCVVRGPVPGDPGPSGSERSSLDAFLQGARGQAHSKTLARPAHAQEIAKRFHFTVEVLRGPG